MNVLAFQQSGPPRPTTPNPAIALRTGPPGRHLVDITLLFAPRGGGVRRYLLAKHRWLRQHSRIGHTVLVPGRVDDGIAYDFMRFASPAVPFSGGYRLPLRTQRIRDALARLAADLIEVGDPYHLARQALSVAQAQRVPAIAFCHSDVVKLTNSLAGAWAGRAVQRYVANLYARFDLVLAPSAIVAERLWDIGVRGIEVQSLGVDTSTFHPGARDQDLRAELGVARDARLLMFAGRLSREKNVRDLVAAARMLGKRYHLLLVGGGRPALLARNVSVLSYQQDERQLARLLASGDAFVHAGDQETFGLVVLEAMACGLPVVAARAGALPEIVDSTVGATFAARNPAALARAVADLFERDLAGLSASARRRAEAHSWDVAFTRLLGRYARLMARSPSPRERTANGR